MITNEYINLVSHFYEKVKTFKLFIDQSKFYSGKKCRLKAGNS
jgi:hypothetical protein